MNVHVRQSAVVNLFSAVKEHWTRAKENETFDPLAEDKITLKDNLLEAVIKCADIRKI